jgi:hypothetical protein
MIGKGTLGKAGIFVAMAVLLPDAGLARDKTPEILNRSGRWEVNYDRDACHLFAEFGSGDAAVIMRISRFEPGDKFDFSLYGKRLAASGLHKDAKLDFGLRGVPVKAEGLLGSAGQLPAIFFNSQRLDGWEYNSLGEKAPEVAPAQEAAVKGVSVAIEGKRPFRLEFGSLAKPLEQMRACSANLVGSWGYDPEVQATLSRPVTPRDTPRSWLDNSDYPLSPLTEGRSGIVRFRLDVDAQGKVVGCFILATTGPDSFADLTCKIIARRAKLLHALDAKGQPVRSYYVQKVNWIAG